MRPALRISRDALVAVLLAVLAGCQSLGPVAPPPSVDAAERLARDGNPYGAAVTYEALGLENAGADRNEFLLRAARLFIVAARVDDSSRVLGMLVPPLTPPQALERTLLEGEADLARGQGAQAWQRVAQLPDPADQAAAARLGALKMRAAIAAERPSDAVRAEIASERHLPTPAARGARRLELFAELREASERGGRVDPQAAKDRTVRGWLEIGPLAAAAAANPAATAPQIEAWRARYPNHPAGEIVRTELLGQPAAPAQAAAAAAAGAPGSEARSPIALLLPLSGRLGSAAATIRDGFMTAWFEMPAESRPSIRVYDTAAMPVTDALAAAAHAGAAVIVGPLTREEVGAAADDPSRTAPLLALNALPAGRSVPNGLYQFALSPEDEARAVARRVAAQGLRRGIAFAPDGDWGTRVMAAFRDELTAAGGQLVGASTLASGQADYSPAITQALRLTDSRARHKRLESILRTKLEFEPRRRGDIEFIFAAGQPGTSRLLRPQLRFHAAGDIPTFATSDAYEPGSSSNQDLQGLVLPEMPWMLDGDPAADNVRASVQAAWPTGGPRRNRLFAFGYDALRLAAAIGDGRGDTAIDFAGLTGHLTVDAQRRIRRDLDWAQVDGGNLRILDRGPSAQ